MLRQRLMWIAWPAFLIAGLLEIVVFGMVDPEDLQWFGHPINLSRQGVYTISFFVFWALSIASSTLTTMLSISPFEQNRCPLEPTDRPVGCPKLPDDASCHGGCHPQDAVHAASTPHAAGLSTPRG